MRLNPMKKDVYRHYVKLYLWTFKGIGKDKYFSDEGVRKFGISAINVYAFATEYAGWFWN
jgi:hypothetical protein